MPNEAGIWKLLLPYWRRYGADPQRTEVVSGAGVPDLNCIYQGREFWIEGKMIKGNIVTDRKRPEQLAWLERRARLGGRVWVLGRKGNTLYLWEGKHARALSARGAFLFVSPSHIVHIPDELKYKGLLYVCAGLDPSKLRLGSEGSAGASPALDATLHEVRGRNRKGR